MTTQKLLNLIMERTGKDYKQIAADLDYSHKTVCDWKNGRYEPSERALKLIYKKYKKIIQ